MKSSPQAVFITWRFNLLIILILIIISGLMIRLVELAVFKKHFLQTQGDARALRVVTSPSVRGMITDREGYPLAVSTSVYSIWMNPKEWTNDVKHLKSLSQLLKINPKTITKSYLRYKDTGREFVYLKRDISPELASQIKELKIPGIYQEESFKRFYPEGEVAAHVVGFTNVDDQGQEGLELAFNQLLTGMPGKRMVIKDRLGRIISNVQEISEKKPGHDLALSIHHNIQYIAYRELLAGFLEYQAESASVVVIDIKTGEILAMANLPSFNPNNRSIPNLDLVRNRAVTDTFEPGSTIKAFSIASAFDAGHYTPDTMIDTHPGWMRVGRNIVQDEHNLKEISVTQILQRSSNVGITKMILSIPPNELWEMLHNVGFGEMTGVGFPGERTGELQHREVWSPFALATLAFGYGLSVTTLQLAEAYAVIANHGIKIPLSLVKIDEPPKGKQVMKEKIADQMLTLLESVLTKGGTGVHANIPGYRVAGKTGTARMVGKNGYEKDHHVSSFVGIAPVSNPRYVVAVVIRDPKGKHYLGGEVAGPIFKKVMEGTLRTFNIPVDTKRE